MTYDPSHCKLANPRRDVINILIINFFCNLILRELSSENYKHLSGVCNIISSVMTHINNGDLFFLNSQESICALL